MVIAEPNSPGSGTPIRARLETFQKMIWPSRLPEDERRAVGAEGESHRRVDFTWQRLADRVMARDMPEDDFAVKATRGERRAVGTERECVFSPTMKEVPSKSCVGQGAKQASLHLGRVGHAVGLEAEQEASVRSSQLTSGLRGELACEGHRGAVDLRRENSASATWRWASAVARCSSAACH